MAQEAEKDTGWVGIGRWLLNDCPLRQEVAPITVCRLVIWDMPQELGVENQVMKCSSFYRAEKIYFFKFKADFLEHRWVTL